MNINYVTFDETGALTGGYLQEVQPDHLAAYFEVTPEQRVTWPAWRMNAARDGLEAAPIVTPEPQIPQAVTRRQGLQMLRIEGITETMVEAKIIELIPDGIDRDLAMIEFRTSQTFERQRQLTITLGAAFALDLDALFVSGAVL